MLFELEENGQLHGAFRRNAAETIRHYHYLKSVPSGKSYFVRYEVAVIVWSIPANNNVSNFLIGKPNAVWELSRMWAPDGHRANLLTEAIAFAVRFLKRAEPTCAAVVSYADPNVGHHGGVYLAASWMRCGQCEESRYYVRPDGTTTSRRSFHSGDRRLTTEEVKARGVSELRKPGKLRFAHPLKRWARRELEKRFPCS